MTRGLVPANEEAKGGAIPIIESSCVPAAGWCIAFPAEAAFLDSNSRDRPAVVGWMPRSTDTDGNPARK